MFKLKTKALQPGAEKIRYFQQEILKWFKSNARDFPWRSPLRSEYEIVISEVLLQRTKAEQVNRFFNDFLLIFPGWDVLANENLEVIENYLKPLGLQVQRAKRLSNLAKYMSEAKGELPKERIKLEEIPFMGQYIANAVELLIHKNPKPLLDVNMARVLERFFGPRKLSDIRYDPYLQSLALEIVQHPASKEVNWAILDFAALVCKARLPLCENCQVSARCLFYTTIKKTYS